VSAQTGRPGVARPPPSSRRLDRARVQLQRLSSDPNPVWLRELRQSARLMRTPIILAVVTAIMTLLMASIGGIASVSAEPAKVGVALFHTFFSLAFFVVTWVAPAVAANSISSEKGGRTWEALLLTGLGSPIIARGKFMASLTYIGLYVVMLAPVGALSFLFGGVTAIEVIAGFALLFLFAGLSVAFGLSMSSAFNSPAVAIVVTLLVAVPLSLAAYLGLGVGLSNAAHFVWPEVPAWAPVWLPTAYVRADFGTEYVAYLLLTPLVVALLPAWFLYEVTMANMASASDDRSSGLRRWILVCVPTTAAGLSALTFAAASHWRMATWGMALTAVVLLIITFVIAGEPLGPSRRVRVHWERAKTGALRRFFGPGILRAAALVLLLGLLGLALQTGLGAIAVTTHPGAHPGDDVARVLFTGMYLAGFHVFLVGFTAFCRARSKTGATPRLVLLGTLFLALIGPWVVMAIGGVVTDGSDAVVVLAAPSPTYVPLVVYDWIGSSRSGVDLVLLAGGACALGWAVLGFGLLGAAGLRTRRVIGEHRRALTKVEEMLAREDTVSEEAPEAAQA
jgi:ABC-type transport system involved in multi-copper enzyme maturation permease subunit